MIADRLRDSVATGSIEWEGVLVGALDCAVNQHSLCVGWIKSGCSDSKPSSFKQPSPMGPPGVRDWGQS